MIYWWAYYSAFFCTLYKAPVKNSAEIISFRRDAA
jgi:hypothetical protein